MPDEPSGDSEDYGMAFKACPGACMTHPPGSGARGPFPCCRRSAYPFYFSHWMTLGLHEAAPALPEQLGLLM